MMIKVSLVMATTINGYIAGENDDTDWVKDLESFKKMIKEFKVIVKGKRTYLECVKYNVFPYIGALNIVLTHDRELLDRKQDSVLFSDKTPKEIIEIVNEKGFERMLVVGGGHLNGSFLRDNLIDEIIVDLHPVVMAKGINIFAADFPKQNLDLIEFKPLNDQILQVKYKVKK